MDALTWKKRAYFFIKARYKNLKTTFNNISYLDRKYL